MEEVDAAAAAMVQLECSCTSVRLEQERAAAEVNSTVAREFDKRAPQSRHLPA